MSGIITSSSPMSGIITSCVFPHPCMTDKRGPSQQDDWPLCIVLVSMRYTAMVNQINYVYVITLTKAYK